MRDGRDRVRTRAAQRPSCADAPPRHRPRLRARAGRRRPSRSPPTGAARRARTASIGTRGRRPPARPAAATTRSSAAPATTASTAAPATTCWPATRAATSSPAGAAPTRCSAAPAATGSARPPAATPRHDRRRAPATTSIDARDGSPDRITCGGGRDRVRADRGDDVARRLRAGRPWLTAPATRPVVLLVDDDAAIRRTVAAGLELEGFDVVLRVGRARPRSRRSVASRPAVMLLDLTMPDLDGLEVLRRLRGRGDDLPVCVLSARDEVDDRILGLRDRRRRLRGQAVLGRGGRRAPARAAAPPPAARGRARRRRRPRARPARRTARAARGRDLGLTRREFELLTLFMRHPGEVLERRRLHEEVWGYTLRPGHERRPTCSSATCGASSRRAASRACCTRCAGSASCCEPDGVRNLRGRLTLGVLAVLAVVLAVAGVLVARDVDRTERRGARRPPAPHRRALAGDRAGRRRAGAARRRPPPRRRPAARRAARCGWPSARPCCSTPATPLRLPLRSAPGLRTVTIGGERYRVLPDDAARARASAGSCGCRSRRASTRSRSARPRCAAGSRRSARSCCSSPAWACGSPPTSSCARCGACAR